MSQVRYRVLDPNEFTPPDEHDHLAGDEYLAPSAKGVDALESQGVVDVLEWDYSGSDIEFSGPAEPIVSDSDDEEDAVPEIVYVHDDAEGVEPKNELRTIELGTWECQRCGTRNPTGIDDGNLVEPPECEGCERQGPFAHAGGFSDTDVQAALRADRMWYPPSGVSDSHYDALWDDVREYLRDHWDASEPEVYAGLTAFALSTWVRENLTFVPHLMLMGKTTGGKTRLLNTLSRVSYRAVVTSSATPASMFRLIDAYDVTYYISEYHGLDHDAQRELDNIVRAGQKRGEVVTRAEPSAAGYEPMVFDPFSHIAIATQYTPADDIVNRCIQVRSSPANRDMPATLDEERAREIRNRLLYARYRLLDSDEWATAEADAYDYLQEHNITARTREKLLSLVTIAFVWDRVDKLEPFVEAVVEQDQEAAADSEDALVVEAIRNLAFEEIGSTTVLGDGDPFAAVEIPLSDIAEQYEAMTGTENTSSWVGHVRSRLDLEKARRRDGTVISDPELGPKLRELCEDHNLDWKRTEAHDPAPELPDDEQGVSTCPECSREGMLTHRDLDGGGGRVCSECADDIRAHVERERAGQGRGDST